MQGQPFTSQNAAIMARKGAETRRRLKQERLERALNGQGDAHPAQTRLSRLWVSLAVIDERIKQDIERGNLDKAAKLAGIARSLQAQAQDLRPSNGHKKPAPIAAPPDPLA